MRLTGLDGVLKLLESLPPELVSKRGGPVKSALRKGALVIFKAAKANLQAAVSNTTEQGKRYSTGLLLANLVVTRGKAPTTGKGERYLVRVRKKSYGRKGEPVTTLKTAQLLEYGSEPAAGRALVAPGLQRHRIARDHHRRGRAAEEPRPHRQETGEGGEEMILPPVFQTLKASAEVKAIVGTNPPRIYRHGSAPQYTDRPYISWFLVSGIPENNLSDPPPADRSTVQIDAWHPEDAGVELLAHAIREAVEPSRALHRRDRRRAGGRHEALSNGTPIRLVLPMNSKASSTRPSMTVDS